VLQKKIKIIATILIIISFSNCKKSDNDFSSKKLFDLNWEFNNSNNKFASVVEFNDDSWIWIDLPHDWKNNYKSLFKYNNKMDSISPETIWYRKYFEIPRDWHNKNISIYFEGISGQNKIFINGVLIDQFHKKNGSYKKNISSYLNYKGNNVITIKEVNLKEDLGIYDHVWLILSGSSNSMD